MDLVTNDFGPNDWLVDEMYRKYAEDPASVSARWREFFADYKPRAEIPTPSRPAAELRTQPPEPFVDKRENETAPSEDAGTTDELAHRGGSGRRTPPRDDERDKAVAT